MAGPRVTVVEEDGPLCTFLERILAAEGYVVDVVNRGDEAEVRLSDALPDLLILDLAGVDLATLSLIHI